MGGGHNAAVGIVGVGDGLGRKRRACKGQSQRQQQATHVRPFWLRNTLLHSLQWTTAQIEKGVNGLARQALQRGSSKANVKA
jgi:hypothetical protein